MEREKHIVLRVTAWLKPDGSVATEVTVWGVGDNAFDAQVLMEQGDDRPLPPGVSCSWTKLVLS